ncbi:MAG TPA: hypothetical protein VNX15_00430 [Gemmatimonadales bacterium]|jgi:hypothetical protein|nr:hypothetical protein [Gemmatimonadales bacterium]
MSRRTQGLALVVAMVMWACSHNPTGPQAGTLYVKLQSPNSGADGAILLTLSTPGPVTHVAVTGPDTLWTTDYSSTNSKVLITGAISGGVILKFDVDDVNLVSQYLVTVDQVASSSDYSLRSLSQYVAFVSR